MHARRIISTAFSTFVLSALGGCQSSEDAGPANTSQEEQSSSSATADEMSSIGDQTSDPEVSTQDSTTQESTTTQESGSQDSTTSTTSEQDSTQSTDTTDSTSEDSQTTESDTSETETSLGTKVEVSISRSVAVSADNDGIGGLYLSLMKTCASDGESAASGIIENADLSSDGAAVMHTFTDVNPGTYYLTGFLDDNLSASSSAPAPDKGDIVAAEGIGPKCTTVEVKDQDVSGVLLDLNFIMPF